MTDSFNRLAIAARVMRHEEQREATPDADGMTDIPEDILDAAENALDNLLCNCRESCGSYEALRLASIRDIARAILAERERCALIADYFEHVNPAVSPYENHYWEGASDASDGVAAAIRTPSTLKSQS